MFYYVVHMKLIIFFTFISVSLFSATDFNLTYIEEAHPFKHSNIVLEKTNSHDHLIYSTMTLEKKPKIVYSLKKFKELNLKELEITLLFCHELGHFDGGAPFKMRGRSQRKSWSSSEGQADYFSTLKCIKDFDILAMDYTKIQNSTIKREVSEICKSDKECEMMLASIYKLTRVYQSWTNDLSELSFYKTNLYPASATILEYPSNQCRLMTLFNGYMCKSYDLLSFECLDALYIRPSCWFLN